MNLQEKRQRIAEFLDQGKCKMCGFYHWNRSTGFDHQCNYPPDYLGNRDDMIEALKKLPENRRAEFGEWLLTGMLHKDMIPYYPVTMQGENTRSEICGPLDLVYLILQAPAWMLAQAFADTMGLWKEPPP